MKVSDVALIVGLSASLDRFASAARVSEAQVVAWAAVIDAKAPSMPVDAARAAVIEFYGSGGQSMQVGDLVALWRRLNAADVRAAKALGVAPHHHHEHAPLEPAAAAALARYRTGVAQEMRTLEAVGETQKMINGNFLKGVQ